MSGFARGNEGRVIMPIYVICDVSRSMASDISELNKGLRQIQLGLMADPIVDDLAMLSIITFDRKARTVVPLASPSEVVLPTFQAGGGTVYGAAFREYHRAFELDRAILKSDGNRVLRPYIFFLSGSEPEDADHLQTFHSLLGYEPRTHQGNAAYPHVITFGFRNAQPAIMESLAYPRFGEPSKRGLWFTARQGHGMADLLRSITGMIGTSVLQSR